MKKNPFKKYISQFSESKFWRKLSRFGRQAGIQVTYSALLLFYAYQRKETPSWAKRLVLGILGYLILPIDGLPDLTPILGYTDDLGMLSFGLVAIAAHVNTDVKDKARVRLKDWFGEFDEAELKGIDDQI